MEPKKQYETCCICGKQFEVNSHFWGNNPEPVKSQFAGIKMNVCCNECNDNVVIPARMSGLNGW